MANKPTSEKLAESLTHSQAPHVMIDRARAGHYDEYKSDLPFPISALVEDARKYHLNNIALRAINGEFDAQDWEANQWAESEEGRLFAKVRGNYTRRSHLSSGSIHSRGGTRW
jgi:hypothetical protein